MGRPTVPNTPSPFTSPLKVGITVRALEIASSNLIARFDVGFNIRWREGPSLTEEPATGAPPRLIQVLLDAASVAAPKDARRNGLRTRGTVGRENDCQIGKVDVAVTIQIAVLVGRAAWNAVIRQHDCQVVEIHRAVAGDVAG